MNAIVMLTTVAKMLNAGIQTGAILVNAITVTSVTASYAIVRKLFYNYTR